MKLAVASCANLQQINPQPAWADIQREQPDVLLLIGDNIYLDHNYHIFPSRLRNELRQLYAAQFAEPNFAALINDIRVRNANLLAIYDDHDFLGNNRYGGDYYNPLLRKAARDEFIRAFAPPLVGYDVYRKFSSSIVDIIVLDERFYRESPANSRGDRDAILGAQQWAWFEGAVASSNAKFLVIASSTTFHSFTLADESWEQYPGAFDRMRNLLLNHSGSAMIVSGDVHRNALYDDSGVIEVVTSGVARKGIVYGKERRNYGILTFANDFVRIELKSLQRYGLFDVTLYRSSWSL